MKRLYAIFVALTLSLLSTSAFALGGGHWTSWARRVVPRAPSHVTGFSTADQWDAALGVTLATGVQVSTWASQQGGGHTLAALYTGANAPTFTATGGPNNKPHISGVAAASQTLHAAYTRAEPRTIYIVGKWDLPSAAGSIWEAESANLNRIYRSDATTLSGLGGAGAFNASSVGNLSNWHVLVFVANGASSSFQEESGTLYTGNSGSPSPDGAALFSAGTGANPSDSSVAEVWDFAAAHTAAERAAFIAYLQNKFTVF